MKSKSINIIIQNKDITSVFIVTAAILIVPLVAMQLTNEVKWTIFDFTIMATLLIGTGLLIVLAVRKIKNSLVRSVAIFALLVAFLLIWVELAVGLFDTFFSGT